MSRPRLPAIVAGVSLALAGCTTAPPQTPTPSATSTQAEPSVTATPAPRPTPTVTPTSTPVVAPTPSPAPTPSGTLTITLDGVDYAAGGDVDTVSYDDGSGVVDLLSSLSGSEPAVTDIEDPWGNGTVMGARYGWEGIVVSVFNGRAGVAISVPEVGDTTVQTPEGISVGSTRAEVMAAGAWPVWDQDGNGNANYLGIGSREVPDTRSLSNPGSVGIEYLMLVLSDDVVAAIHVPANDFSDI